MSRTDYEDDRPAPQAAASAGLGVGIVLLIVGAVALVGICVIGALIALLLPAVDRVRGAAARMQGANNLKQIALALHNYHDSHGCFPPPYTTLPNGQPGVSWRVLILPYIEQYNLYRMYKLDEPWDGPNNAALSAIIVKTYCHPSDPPSNMTRLRIFVGGGAMFDKDKKTILGIPRKPEEMGVTDGTANTFMVVEAGDLVPWAKPEEMEYDPRRPLPKLGQPSYGGDFQAAFADGSVRMLNRKTPEQTIRALITANGGDIPGDF
jgi:hypothetical protein